MGDSLTGISGRGKERILRDEEEQSITYTQNT
jgi:hypothetical protein